MDYIAPLEREDDLAGGGGGEVEVGASEPEERWRRLQGFQNGLGPSSADELKQESSQADYHPQTCC